MLATLETFARDDRGQGVLEYALIITLVSVAAFASLVALGGKVNNTFLNNAAALFP